MERLKYFTICLDGIDKSGKNAIGNYLFELSRKRYLINVRGYMTMAAYAKVYNRPVEYSIESQSHILNVLLEVDYEDWKIRCSYTKEPQIDFQRDSLAFQSVFYDLKAKGYPCLRLNTTELSPYKIAKTIIETLDHLNESENSIKIKNFD